MTPKVSIIIPAFNQATLLGAAIASVLEQTYSDWELIVVDDGSSDGTRLVPAIHSDSRIRYIFQANAGLPAARNTGIASSIGGYLAFLDADDLYHPEKLSLQVAHLDSNAEVGLSYSSRIEIDERGDPLWIVRAPAEITLKALALGFPFTINDVLVRRTWVERVNGFDEAFVLNSEDRDFYLRLALEGCSFGMVNRCLAYRRLHKGRVFRDLVSKARMSEKALETLFSDPRCPAEILSFKNQALAVHYLSWAYEAAVHEDADLAQRCYQEAIHLDSGLVGKQANKLVNSLVHSSIRKGEDHVSLLEKAFAHLPPELILRTSRLEPAIGRGYFVSGARELIWGRLAEGQTRLAQAAGINMERGEALIGPVIDQLLGYESEFGRSAAEEALGNLSRTLKDVGLRAEAQRTRAIFSANLALSDLRQARYSHVIGNVLRAVSIEPRFLANRGLLAALCRSVFGLLRSRLTAPV